MNNPTENNGIQRGPDPDLTDQRRALVTRLIDDVKKAKERHRTAFARMRDDMKFVRKQLPMEMENDDRTKVNIVQRFLNTRVAVLYAKSPTFIAQTRKRMDFTIWDGKRASLQAAAQAEAQAQQQGMPPPPGVMELMADVQQGLARRELMSSIGRTLEIALTYSLDEQQPPFKAQAKQLVRRTITCGVGYAKLSFQRELAKRPDTEASLPDITDRVSTVERLSADLADGKSDPGSADAEELNLAKGSLTAEKDQIVREGLVIDFPPATRIIPFLGCRQLAPGFPGAPAVAEDFLLSPEQVKEVYGVDVGSNFVGYTQAEYGQAKRSTADTRKCLAWEIYHRKDGLKYVVLDGFPDFLVEPAAPDLAYLEIVFPFIPLIFNQIEDEEDIFPESDVRLLRPIQRELNRKKEALKQHRVASRPLYTVRKGVLEDDDRETMGKHQAHDIIELQGIDAGEDVTKVFAPFPKVGIDPNLYETSTDMSDMQAVVGSQDGDGGGNKNGSATQSSIAETSRMTSVSSNVDDLDDFLSILARQAGQVLLRELSKETALKIVGPGAVWPEFTAQDIAEEVFLQIEAGSSGRPNKAQELANIERVAPFIMQTPGMNPEFWLKYMLRVLDTNIEYEDAVTDGLPSMTAMNGQKQLGTGDPATDPNAQGSQGGNNAPVADGTPGGPQAAFPAGAPASAAPAAFAQPMQAAGAIG
jgi:hypothetical protein